MNIGGPSIHVALLSGELDPRRFATCLVVGTPDAKEGNAVGLVDGRRARLVLIRSLRRALHPLRDAVSLGRLIALMWRERPQVIHTHMAKAGALGRTAGMLYNRLGPGRRRPAVIVHTFHGHVLEGYFFPHVTRLFITIEQRLARWSDRLIAVSPAVKRDLIDRRIAPPEKIIVIPLGLPLESLLALNGFDRVESGPLTIAWVGRLVPIKRPDLFVRGLAQFRRSHPDRGWQAVMAGDGERRGEVQALIEGEGLSARVRCLGWVTDLAALYAQAEIVCLTSANEGTPVSVIEAMAAGRAVVATDVGGVRDLLDGGSQEPVPPGGYRIGARGLLVRSGDADGIAAALERLTADAPLRRRLGQAGREHAANAFNSARLLQDITTFYGTLLDEKASTACMS